MGGSIAQAESGIGGGSPWAAGKTELGLICADGQGHWAVT